MTWQFYNGQARDPDIRRDAKIAIVDDDGNCVAVAHGRTWDEARDNGRRIIDAQTRTPAKRVDEIERGTIAQVRQTLVNAQQFLEAKPTRKRMSDATRRQIRDALAVMDLTWPIGRLGA